MWPRLVNAALGIWLMAAPEFLEYGRPLATSDWIVGPLVASFAVMAIWEVLRSLRWANAGLGAWVAVAPWVLGGPDAAVVNGVLCGLGIGFLALAGGRVESTYGGGWREAWPFKRRNPA